MPVWRGKVAMVVALMAAVGIMLIVALSHYAPLRRNRDKDRSPRLFGATYMTMNNPYFEVINSSLDNVITSNGDILIARDPARDQAKQNAEIRDMIEEGICVLFLNPVDWKGVKPALEACREAGVIVINIDTLVYDTQYVASIIESDNYQAGVLCAIDMMKKKTEARIVVLDSLITTSIRERVQGFLDTIADRPSFEVVRSEPCDGELEIALRVVGDILDSGLDFDVILGGNDPSALGALAALQQHQRDTDILIYGIDGSPDFKAMLKAGLVEGTSVQSPKTIGTIAADTAYRLLAGEEVSPHITVPVSILTQNTLDNADLLGWQ